MKNLSTLLFIFYFGPSSFGQDYKINSNTIWFTSQGVNYTEGHFEKIRRFAEFLLDTKLNFIEISEAKREAKSTFLSNPLGTLNEVAEIDQQMQQVYNLTDVQTVGLVRSALLLHVFDALSREPRMPLLGKYIEKHCKILAYDVANNLVFTQKDANGFLNLMEFIVKINGSNAKYSFLERKQAIQHLSQNFNSFNLQQKQAMAIMGILNDYIQTVYQKASFLQKNQIKEELNNSFANANTNNIYNTTSTTINNSGYNNMDARSYQMLSNMMMTSHVTSMNIISSISGSGDYWYIKHY